MKDLSANIVICKPNISTGSFLNYRTTYFYIDILNNSVHERITTAEKTKRKNSNRFIEKEEVIII